MTACCLGLTFALVFSVATIVHAGEKHSESELQPMTGQLPRKLEVISGSRTRKRAKDSKGKGVKKASEREKGRSHTSASKQSRKKEKREEKRSRDFCSAFDSQRSNSSDIIANIFSGSVGKGKRKGRRQGERGLQAGGQGCFPSGLETARQNANLSIFVDLIEFANLEEIFSCSGPFTILAPSNTAFNENPDLLRSLFNPRNVEAVEEMLLYHIVQGFFTSADIVEGPLQTLSNDSIDVFLAPFRFNQAGVSQVDLLGCNSVIHIIDDTLIPSDSPVLPKICELLDLRTSGQFPNSPWFRKYFLSGSGDKQRSLQFMGERCRVDIFDVLQADQNLSYFSALLEAADLKDIFLCAGPFTVLAPVNAAFSTLDPDVLEQLLEPSMKENLQELLLRHVLPNHKSALSFSSGSLETLLGGANVTVAIDPLMFDSSGVVITDIGACNGIIHSIDGVLMPSDSTFCDDFVFAGRWTQPAMNPNCSGILDIARNDPNLSTALSLIEAVGLDSIFGCEGPFTALIPSNDAFTRLSPESLRFLTDPANLDALRNVLLYHILPGISLSSSLVPGPRETLLSDEQVTVRVAPVRFDNSSVIEADIEACQGIVHVLNNTLIPFAIPTPSPTPSFDCGEFTFNRRSRQLQTDGQDCDGNILDTARLNSDLTIVTTLIDVAGLTPVFTCAGSFTGIFPSNTAFDDVPSVFLDDLLLAQNIDRLREFLLYHIIPGAMLTSQFVAGPQDTLVDAQIDVTLDPLEFNGFDLFNADLPACNGYVNIVSGLLNPFRGAPTITPSSSSLEPTPRPVERLTVRDFYVSFVAEGTSREPSVSEYNEMVQRTADYFGQVFRDFFSSSSQTEFLRAEATLDGTLFGPDAGIPEERFNIYIDFSFSDFIFTADSVIPSTMELFDLMGEAISPTYITDVARTFTGTPFASVTEAFFSASETDFP